MLGVQDFLIPCLMVHTQMRFFYMHTSTYKTVSPTSAKSCFYMLACARAHFNMINSTKTLFSTDVASIQKHLADKQWVTHFCISIKEPMGAVENDTLS